MNLFRRSFIYVILLCLPFQVLAQWSTPCESLQAPQPQSAHHCCDKKMQKMAHCVKAAPADEQAQSQSNDGGCAQCKICQLSHAYSLPALSLPSLPIELSAYAAWRPSGFAPVEPDSLLRPPRVALS